VAHEGHAALIGYVDDEYIYLIPLATEAYLQDASRRTGKVWPVDMTTLLKELEEAGHIYVKPEKDRMRREPKKKIKGQSKRYIWLKRATLGKPDDPDDTPADISGTTPRREPGDEPPDPDPAPTPDLFNDDIPF